MKFTTNYVAGKPIYRVQWNNTSQHFFITSLVQFKPDQTAYRDFSMRRYAVDFLNHAILDLGLNDAKLVVLRGK